MLVSLYYFRNQKGHLKLTVTPTQPNNPLHGITLKAAVTDLVAHYGWESLAQDIPINCFSHDPSVKSSLTFLRKNPWARDRVEALYLKMLREI